MAKKSKSSRPNIPEAALARARAELNGEIQAPLETKPQNGTVAPRLTPAKAAPISSGKTVTIEELKQEYTYVIADLRSMAILAGILFVALIVASLILV